MARITPIDAIKGISGKHDSGSRRCFATATGSNRIHLARYLGKPARPATPEQLFEGAGTHEGGRGKNRRRMTTDVVREPLEPALYDLRTNSGTTKTAWICRFSTGGICI